MTIWKRERAHFNYYITNERKQPHIYVEALGTPSASTEKVLKDHGFKFDHNKCMYAAAQTNDLRLFVAHDLDKYFSYDVQLFFNTEAKKELCTIDVFNRNKLIESYVYNNGKIEKMSVENAAPKKKKKATLTEQQKINKMLEDFEFPF